MTGSNVVIDGGFTAFKGPPAAGQFLRPDVQVAGSPALGPRRRPSAFDHG